MKIVNNQKKVMFGALSPLDVFSYGGNVFLKTYEESEGVNTVSLSTGRLCNFHDGDPVTHHPEAELHLNKKG